MPKDIFINPKGFDADVEGFDKSASDVSAVKANDVKHVKKKTSLDSMDLMTSIIDAFAQCVDHYVALSKKDVGVLKHVKDEWVRTDGKLGSEIGGK
ncbi:hypothetical protein ACFO4N_16595 [Camelliibacillus cellulosilyticus]|uniref:Type VII secretion effector (TIGR04197 family) n=1 Tax=Camelliibacillus cellulosilyticus TaxID=2174486 RepID=A0ABV9GQP0_9BACL